MNRDKEQEYREEAQLQWFWLQASRQFRHQHLAGSSKKMNCSENKGLRNGTP